MADVDPIALFAELLRLRRKGGGRLGFGDIAETEALTRKLVESWAK